MSIKKYYEQHWLFECPDAVLTCAILKDRDDRYILFGGHDKNLYIMDTNLNIIDDIEFDGWVRCCFTIDLNGDGTEEVLVGSGDGSLLVLKLKRDPIKLFGIMHFKSTGKINCCTAGDLYRNGNKEIICGGENKTLMILENTNSKKPLEIFYYDSWVMTCT